MDNFYDVVVIGAGPAGSIATAKLLKEGKSLLVLEKMEFPRFVIGESLLPHCMDFLEELDLLKCIEAEKFQEKTGVCFYHKDEICDFLFKDQFTENSWHYTWQVKRAKFDYALIQEVENRGASVLYKTEVTNVECSETEQRVTFVNDEIGEQRVSCRFVLDASGYGRVLPRMFNLEQPVSTPPRGAIFTHLEDTKRTDKAGRNIFVHAFNDNTAWIWSIPFSDGTCSVGVVADKAYIEKCAENNNAEFLRLLAEFPGLSGRFADADLIFEPKVIVNYAVSVKQLHGTGYALCGNSTEFLDPIFSSGVTLAISSGYRAAMLANKQLNGDRVDWDTDYAAHMKHGINVFRSYVNGWYEGKLARIFFTKEPNEGFMRQICSVLAGYVWDETNPFVKKHDTILTTLSRVIEIQEE